ncbi:MAG TPA: hypothetical protein VJO32_05590, partial [Ktedonobacteraceae bacterium]|nr:hypothetical protein [Ktedonobacteraceae bacterium]
MREFLIAQGQVMGKRVTPGLNLLEKSRIDLGSTPLASGCLRVFIKGAFQNRLTREDGGYFLPALRIVGIGQVQNAGCGCLIISIRLDPAIVNGKFFKISKNAQREFRGPGVAPELKSWFAGLFQINDR